MPNEQDDQEVLKNLLLVGPDPEGMALPPDRSWWRREAIYISDVCLAVHLSLAVSSLKEDSESAAKEALYTYLRRVGHHGMEYGLMRPVACVMSKGIHSPSSTLLSVIRSWGLDQEWHRGSFTLYVEIPDPANERVVYDPYKRLVDLLSPALSPLSDMPQKSRTAIDILNCIENQLASDPISVDEQEELLKDLVLHIKEEVIDDNSADAKFNPISHILENWENRIINTSKDMKIGRTNSG